MRKLNATPITASDLGAFLNSDSDFAFEMRVLRWFEDNGFSCRHSGTYRDPVTGKLRQFDIRATTTTGTHTLALAIECKNLRQNCPLLISTVPRTGAEAFHSVIQCHRRPPHFFDVKRVDGVGVYRANQPVGKATDQVGRDTGGQLLSNDDQTFDKVSQAVNGCMDLVERLSHEMSDIQYRIIVPVLVVPTGTLWQVNYDSSGKIAIPPSQVQRSNLFLDHCWQSTTPFGLLLNYRISHLEIVAFEGLSDAVDRWLRGFLTW
jgi:hypothetical protein